MLFINFLIIFTANNTVDEQDNNNKINITFNDANMSDFCKRRSYFSHSTCICGALFNTDKSVNKNNISIKNNNDILLCEMCTLNGTYSINNEIPAIVDQTIDPIYVTVKNSIDCNKENTVDTNKHTNENKNEKNFKNSFTNIMDDTIYKGKIIILY